MSTVSVEEMATNQAMIAAPPTRAAGAFSTPSGSHGLAIKVRLADGRIHEGALDPERHRSIHLGLLHGDSHGFVEIGAGPRPPGGKLRITTRKDAGHFLPGGASGEEGWLEALLALVARHHEAGDEVCVGPAVRRSRGAAKTHVEHTNWL